MSWSPYGFSNLQLRESRFNGGEWAWEGRTKFVGLDTTCDVFSSGVLTGEVHCTEAGDVDDIDHQAVLPPTGLGDYVSLQVSFIPPGYNGGADPSSPCYSVSEHTIGLLSGGCRPLDIIKPQVVLHNSLDYPDLVDIDGRAHSPHFMPGDEGGDYFIVNPTPITYPHMDPANLANEILFPVADLPTEVWFAFPAQPLSVVRVGTAVGKTEAIWSRFYTPIVIDEDVPIGHITAGNPVSGRLLTDNVRGTTVGQRGVIT